MVHIKKILKTKQKKYLGRDTETSYMASVMSQDLPSTSSPLPPLPSPGITEKSLSKGGQGWRKRNKIPDYGEKRNPLV